jgi:hypothetical protein
MKRLLWLAVLVSGVLVGYLSRPPVVQAQPTGFPFRAGDLIQISYAERTQSCMIENFFGSFVSCKTQQDRPFGPETLPRLYNLSTSISVTLSARADAR